MCSQVLLRKAAALHISKISSHLTADFSTVNCTTFLGPGRKVCYLKGLLGTLKEYFDILEDLRSY